MQGARIYNDAIFYQKPRLEDQHLRPVISAFEMSRWLEKIFGRFAQIVLIWTCSQDNVADDLVNHI